MPLKDENRTVNSEIEDPNQTAPLLASLAAVSFMGLHGLCQNLRSLWYHKMHTLIC